MDDNVRCVAVFIIAVLIAYGVIENSVLAVIPFIIAMILLREADAICFLLYGLLVFSMMILFTICGIGIGV